MQQLVLSSDDNQRSSSYDLADLVTGRFDFEGFSHEARVRSLLTLTSVYEMVLALGNTEHTANWDWCIVVTMVDGTEHGYTNEGDDMYSMCDVMRLPYEAEPDDYTTHFTRWKELELEEYPDCGNGDQRIKCLPIDNIKSVLLWYDT